MKTWNEASRVRFEPTGQDQQEAGKIQLQPQPGWWRSREETDSGRHETKEGRKLQRQQPRVVVTSHNVFPPFCTAAVSMIHFFFLENMAKHHKVYIVVVSPSVLIFIITRIIRVYFQGDYYRTLAPGFPVNLIYSPPWIRNPTTWVGPDSKGVKLFSLFSRRL